MKLFFSHSLEMHEKIGFVRENMFIKCYVLFFILFFIFYFLFYFLNMFYFTTEDPGIINLD